MKPEIKAYRRFLNVIAAADAAREAHPELAYPLNWTRLQRVLTRERIHVLREDTAAKAYVMGGDGCFVIVVNSGLLGRHHTRIIAHEYAHIKLHLLERGEVVRQLAPCRRGDPREYEAELFALLLRLGPTATPDQPDIARLVAKLEAPAYRARIPEQIPLSLPERIPEYRPPSKQRVDFNDWSIPVAERRKAWLEHIARQPKRGRVVSHDQILFDWSRDGKPLRYFHLQLGWVEIYDLLIYTRGGQRRVEILQCGDRRAQARVFVRSATDRRRYVFEEEEKRGRSPKELDWQISQAKIQHPHAASAKETAAAAEKIRHIRGLE